MALKHVQSPPVHPHTDWDNNPPTHLYLYSDNGSTANLYMPFNLTHIRTMVLMTFPKSQNSSNVLCYIFFIDFLP